MGKLPIKSSTSSKKVEDQTEALPYPVAVFYIVATEFCERFTYYGMRAVLIIYMRNMLHFSDDEATTFYHIYMLLCYSMPVVGALIADSFWGKYKTILYISYIYAIGCIVMSVAAIPPLHLPASSLSMVGLVLIAIGTGGIKPCVIALGGEQFVLPQQEKKLEQFFSVFFFAVTIGSMFSTVITPIFRKDVSCFGDDTCYALAFGFPACLMVVAVVIFMSGKGKYKINNPEGNIMVKVAGCISYAIKRKSQEQKKQSHSLKKIHWLDYASDKFDSKLIEDTKRLLYIMIYYIPIPMFWALYDQIGSRWTLQATRMTGVVGSFVIKPDQMQVVNALLMFVFIPFFQSVVYPIFSKCRLLKRPLQRMGVGGFLAAFAFVLAGLVEKKMESTYPAGPVEGETHLNFINTLPCPLNIYGDSQLGNHIVGTEDNLVVRSVTERNMSVVISMNNSCVFGKGEIVLHDRKWQGQLLTLPSAVQSVLLVVKNGSLLLQSLHHPDDVKKSKEGNAKLRIVYNEFERVSDNPYFETELVTTKLKRSNGKVETMNLKVQGKVNTEKPKEIEPDDYEITVLSHFYNTNETYTKRFSGEESFKTGGSYVMVLHQNYHHPNDLKHQLIVLTPPNDVHMLWLLPQYLIMAWAEVLFIISGLEFSFREAPESMKSVMQSCWHLTNAAGNVIVIIVAQMKLTQATEFFAFSICMAVDMIGFSLLAMGFKYCAEKKVVNNSAAETEKSEEKKP